MLTREHMQIPSIIRLANSIMLRLSLCFCAVKPLIYCILGDNFLPILRVIIVYICTSK